MSRTAREPFDTMPGKSGATPLADLEADDRWRAVRMTPTLMLVIAEATAGHSVQVTWDGPDELGFWTPTVTVKQ